MLLIDVDDFKSINDRFGHLAGDESVHLAARLTKCVRNDDVVARIGGDEFVVVLRSGPWPAAMSRRILDAVQQPYLLRGRWVPVSVSIGLVEIGDERTSVSTEDLLDRVDAAMYQAKRFRGPMLVSYDFSGREAESERERRPNPVSRCGRITGTCRRPAEPSNERDEPQDFVSVSFSSLLLG